MKIRKQAVVMIALVLSVPSVVAARSSPNGAFDQVVNEITQQESLFLQNLHKYRPLMETYIQRLRPDRELIAVPDGDEYFLEKLDLRKGTREKSFLPQPGLLGRLKNTITAPYTFRFLPLGFAQMIMPDQRGLDRKHYDFKFVRREFLGELRCLVIDVAPRRGSGTGRFLGRIWVEDQDYNLVRFNGTFSPASWGGRYLHFDSWRLNMQPGLWLPAYVYSEESDLSAPLGRSIRYKSQTRLWGYNLQNAGNSQEFTSISIDSPDTVRDQSPVAQDAMPVEAQRAWERMAEQNALDRLEKAGLLARESEVDKVLTTVISNLEITSNLSIEPEVRARILLTSPLEAFTIGHTIVLSRGLLDVLPDEPTLAAVLAHELAHIALGHKFDTKYAFGDRGIFSDEDALRRFDFHRDPREEEQADVKAMQILQSSPYKDKLQSAGLFLNALQARHRDLPKLVRAHLGNGMFNDGRLRLGQLTTGAPKLEVRRLDQIPALPLGSRIKLDPWNSHVELTKAKPVPLQLPREKLSFEVTPFFPYLVRMNQVEKHAAQTPPGPPNLASGDLSGENQKQ